MKRTILLPILAIAALSIFPVGAARAQSGAPRGALECSADSYGFWHASYAEMREQQLPASSQYQINPGPNGSVRVHGWNQSDVLVRACVRTSAFTDSKAREFASQVKIVKGPGQIEPEIPSRDFWSWFQPRADVSYEVWLPNASNLSAQAVNGAISLEDVHGEIHCHTVNGPVNLDQVSGDVEATTVNGPVKIGLAGNHGEAGALRAKTVNGSVHVNVPANYSAHVEASTVNGGVHVDFPVTVSGTIGGRHTSFQIGSGGPTIEAHTVNGGVYFDRS